jgi:thymidylate kinase
MSPARRVYEVVGVPGAGKSTFIELLTSGTWNHAFLDLDAALFETISSELPKASTGDQTRARKTAGGSTEVRKRFVDLYFNNSAKRFDRLVDFIGSHADYARLVLASIEETNDLESRRLMLKWLFNLFAKYQHSISAGSGRAIILDEGFIGRAVTLFAYREVLPSANVIANYVRLAPKPDAVIRLNADLEVCHSRLGGRPKGPPTRFRALTKEQQLGILKNCSQSLDVALAELSTLGVRVIDIDSGRSPDEQVASAVAALDL